MCKIMTLFKMCFVLLFANLIFAFEFEQSYNFTLDDKKAILDELRIDFSFLNNNKISQKNSIYIYIDNKSKDTNVLWDASEIESMLRKARTTLYQIKTLETQINDINGNYDILDEEDVIVPVKKYDYIYKEDFGGSVSEKINNQIFIHKINNLDLLLEIPLLEPLDSDDVLKISNMPLKFSSDGSALSQFKIGFYLNSFILKQKNETITFDKLGESLIESKSVVMRSSLDISLLKEFRFNDSNVSLPISFNLEKPEDLFFGINQHFKISLNEGLNFTDDFSDVVIVSNNKKVDDSFYDIYVNDNQLNFILNNNISSSSISFKKVLIKSNGTDISSPLIVESKYDKTSIEKNNSRRRRKSAVNARYNQAFIISSQTDKRINIHNIDIAFDLSNDNPYVVINNNNKEHILPDLLIKQNDRGFIKKGDVVNISIPDNIDLKWSENLNLNNYLYSFKKLDEKNMAITMNQELALNDTMKIAGLKFENNNKPIPLFNLKTELLDFDNSNEIFCNNQITIGSLNIELDKSQILFTSDNNPILKKIKIVPDKFSSILQSKDVMYLDLNKSDELSFKVNQKIKSNYSDYLKFKIEKKKIFIEIIKSLPNDSAIILEDILFEKPTKSEDTFKLVYGIVPHNYLSHREFTPFLIESDFKIFDIDFNLFKDVVLVKNIDKKEETFILNDFILKNNSPFKIDDMENIIIDLPEVEYSFVDHDKIYIKSSINEKINYKISKNKLYILTNEILSQERIVIQNLKIKLKTDHPSFYKKPIAINFISNDKNVDVESVKTITYGSPIFRSRDIQYLFENQKIENAYQIKIDFSEVPLISKQIKEILIRIPENIDLKWSNYKKATIDANNILYNEEVQIINNGKDVIVPISKDIPFDNRQIIYVGNLAFADVGSISDEFKLKLSLDSGETFCALDNIKQIVSESNSVIAIKKIFKEKWYPYKKGNTIEFIIKKDAPFEWDLEQGDIYLKRNNRYLSDITPKSNMFDEPELFDNNKRISFKIKSDLETSIIKGAQQMDFGKKLFLNLKLKKTSNDIGVYKRKPFVDTQIETIFGKQILKGQKRDGYDNVNNTEFKNPKYKDESNSVVLKLELKPDSKLEHPIQIRWYRNPTYLLTLSKHRDQNLSIEQKTNYLTSGFKELQNFYNKDYDKRYVNQDWTFWYYLAFYKCNWEGLQGADTKYPALSEPLLSSSIGFDLENAEKYGYNSDIPSVYPEPCNEEVSECKLFYEDIMASFDMQEYNKAYDLLYDEIYVKQRLIGCGLYEVLSRYLFAILSNCVFEDFDIIDGKHTFATYQIEEIKQLLKYGDVQNNFEAYIKDNPDINIKELFLLDPIRIDENCNAISYDNVKNDINISFTDNFINNQSSDFTIKWHNQSEAEKNEWKVSFTDQELLGDDIFLFGTLNTNYIDFNNETQIQGSKTYILDFDPVEKDKKGIWSLGITGLVTILFLGL